MRPPAWVFRRPSPAYGPDGSRDYGPDNEFSERCKKWCADADYSMLDLIRLRVWRKGMRVTRFPDDPEDLFLSDEFGVDAPKSELADE